MDECRTEFERLYKEAGYDLTKVAGSYHNTQTFCDWVLWRLAWQTCESKRNEQCYTYCWKYPPTSSYSLSSCRLW
jgi:hypothetical protein